MESPKTKSNICYLLITERDTKNVFLIIQMTLGSSFDESDKAIRIKYKCS